ncbi:MAG: proline--tRNA ligase, partial [Acidimicrobiia bacterium]
EMDSAGAQETLLPIIQPLELWERTGRDRVYGALMFRLVDRKETGFCLAPTAEEVITSLVGGEYSSYRDLPVNLYQIGWKYRDELRPRFGLLRAREFLMKDAYSFDRDAEGLRASYAAMYQAYHRVFERCGLTFRPVEAQAGEIGGDVNHEFMAVAAVGEDDFVWCRSCEYAANVEAATRAAPEAGDGDVASLSGGEQALSRVPTPGKGGIADVAEFLGIAPSSLLKCIAFDAGDGLGLALVPGDREVSPLALARALGPRPVRLFEETDFANAPGLPRGYIGPHHPQVSMVVADWSVGAAPDEGWVTGANEVDHHARHVFPGRDFEVNRWAGIATVVGGDPCPSCGAALSVDRGIEVGHTFQLGTKYSSMLGATFTDEAGASHPMVMGCYGIGVSRLVAAISEEHHDGDGLKWPAAIAPYAVHLVALPGRGAGAETVSAAAEALYSRLVEAGIEVLYDDREASPGVKFADADLLGVPLQLVLGARGVSRGVVERKRRDDGSRDEVALDGDCATLLGRDPATGRYAP